MRKSTVIIGASIAIVLGVAGIGTAVAVNNPTPPATVTGSTVAPSSAPHDSYTVTTASTVGHTAKGDVCDPSNLNDLICAAFYPDQAVLNMTSRAVGPLATMSDSDKITLAHKACTTLENGGTESTTVLVAPEAANANLYVTATLAYCNDKIVNATGTDTQWVVKTYKAMGEQAAKTSFANKTIISR